MAEGNLMAQMKCPNCARQFVRRIAPYGVGEMLLGIVYVYPFRCQLCGFRFRLPQVGVRYVRVAEDHREYERMASSFPMIFAANNLSGAGSVTNISMGGCSFTTDVALPSGTILQVGLQVTEAVSPVLLDAAVVRYVRGSTVGVEFLQWQHQERERLQLFVRGLLIGSRDGGGSLLTSRSVATAILQQRRDAKQSDPERIFE